MRVLALTRYTRLGASSRLRTYQYLPGLEQRGFSIQVHSLFDDDYLRALYSHRTTPLLGVFRAYCKRLWTLVNSGSFDLIWVEKDALPWVPAKLEQWCLRVPYVVDMDDAVFHRYDQSPSTLVRWSLGRKFQRVMSRASAVTVGNRYLSDYAKRNTLAPVHIIPTSVDLERYQPGATETGKTASAPFVVGWIGTPVTAQYLIPLRTTFQTLARDHGAHFRFVGAPPDLPLGVDYESVPWSEASEVEELQKFDCGIMPLPDEPFARGKSAYKLIQYMACSLPVVASPVGANCDVVLQGSSGYLAGSPAEWLSAIQHLMNSRELCAAMGRKGRDRVRTLYSTQVAIERISECWREVIRTPWSQLTDG